MNSPTLEELFEEAKNYGRIRIYQTSRGSYSCTIVFYTEKHIELEAKSGYDCSTVQKAIIKAIENAIKIVESVKGTNTEKTKKLLGTS